MDATRLQSKIYSGYGKAATRIGYIFDVHRPVAATNPIVSGNIVESINAEFTPRGSGFNFQITSDYRQPEWHGLFDATNVNVGDYLNNATHGTYFVAAKQDHLPILCINCNNSVTIYTPSASCPPGVQTYIGASAATNTAKLTSWPCSFVYDARGRNTGTQLPLDDVKPYFIMLLPALTGLDIRPSDLVKDGNVTPQRNYIITSAERSDLGWRCVVKYEAA